MNIFDLSDISDLPIPLKNKLSILRSSSETRKIINLFKMKDTLTIDEILVGFFREYKKEISRSWVSTTLYNLSRKGFVRKLKVGQYKLVHDIKKI